MKYTMKINILFREWFFNLSVVKKLYLNIVFFLSGIFGMLVISIIGMDTLSALRSYVNAEGLWAKAQKEAVYSLEKYVLSRDEKDYKRFQEFLKVPFGSRKFRLEMQNPSPDLKIAYSGYLDMGNAPEDFIDGVNLFKWFSKFEYMDRAIKVWAEADLLLLELVKLSTKIYEIISSSKSDIHKEVNTQFLERIHKLNKELLVIETRFSQILGEASRWAKNLILKVILGFMVIIFGTGILILHLISKNLLKRIGSLIKVIEQVAKGDLNVKIEAIGKDEIGFLMASFNKMTQDLKVSIQREKELAVDAAAADSLKIYRSLIETTNTGYVILDIKGCVIDANNEYVRLTGYSDINEISGRSVIEWTAPYESEKNASAVKKCAEQGFIRNFEIDYIHRDGTVIPIEINATVVNNLKGELVMQTLCRDITQRRETEKELMGLNQQLRESEQLIELKKAIDQASDGISVIDMGGNIIFINRAMAKMHGYNLEELVGKNISIFHTTEQLTNEVKPLFEKLIKEDSFAGEVKNLRKDGTIFPVFMSGATICEADRKPVKIVAVAHDMTEQKKAEENFRSLFDSVNDGILLADVETKTFHLCNNKICQMMDYKPEEIIKMGVADLSPAEDVPYVLEQFEKQAKREIEIAKDIPVKRKDGSVFFADVNTSTVTLNGRSYLMGILRDITERRKAQEALKETLAQLAQAGKMSAIGELTAGIAHELNQPLNGIKIISQSLQRDIKNDRLKTETLEVQLQSVVSQVDKMANIIQHMRIFTRQTFGSAFKLVDLRNVVSCAFTFIKQQMNSHNIAITNEIPEDSVFVNGNEVGLEQVVLNLLSNAHHALMKDNKEKKELKVKITGVGCTANLSIEDNGTGIPESVIEKLFTPFFTTKDPGQGTGLGLSVSRKIIEEHKGRIEVHSMPGQYTRFEIILPRLEEEKI